MSGVNAPDSPLLTPRTRCLANIIPKIDPPPNDDYLNDLNNPANLNFNNNMNINPRPNSSTSNNPFQSIRNNFVTSGTNAKSNKYSYKPFL